jgi:hypothetical protein
MIQEDDHVSMASRASDTTKYSLSGMEVWKRHGVMERSKTGVVEVVLCMVEMWCSRDGPKEDASTSDYDKEADVRGRERACTNMWQGRDISRSIRKRRRVQPKFCHRSARH